MMNNGEVESNFVTGKKCTNGNSSSKDIKVNNSESVKVTSHSSKTLVAESSARSAPPVTSQEGRATAFSGKIY